ncbi:955b2339-83d4-4de5-84ab-9a6be7907806 [Sclerotinia trifoliorum]|uniref:955b2339-83d4-4de5-84ab-9a6be7907806 n=1 Tax=Sclerotinia trifoliorum TaxID=28548 RepID=A0A8H2VTS8_9HELO|nr:955b2339-83d4-4de5-84ab-9a6be7907806 [Sclerotinia trifoliorum]
MQTRRVPSTFRRIANRTSHIIHPKQKIFSSRWCSTKIRSLRLFLLGGILILYKAQKFFMDETPDGRQRCLEIYGAESWRNAFEMRSYQPRISILAMQSKEVENDPIVSIVIFHKNDGDLGGLELNGKKKYVCDANAIAGNLCHLNDYGAFIGRHDEAKFPILSTAIHISQQPQPVVFPIEQSGIYCVEAMGFTAREFQLLAQFDLGYGQIPAVQLPRLEFSAFLTITSAAAAIISTAYKYFGLGMDAILYQLSIF